MTRRDEVKKEARELSKDAAQKLIPMFIAWVRERIAARRERKKAGK